MMIVSKLRLALLFVVLTLSAFAQDNPKSELGLTIGAEIVPNQDFSRPVILPFPGPPANVQQRLSTSVAFGINYARRFYEGKNSSLYLEFPIAAAPSHDVTSNASNSAVSQATLFITPAVRLQFAPKRAFQPWLSFGGGYALFEGSENLADGSPNPDRFQNTGALQWGCGLDLRTPIRILAPITLRFEVRDFYSLSDPNLNVGHGGNQHNINVKGGFVLRW